jgi:penicillin-binding protein 1A
MQRSGIATEQAVAKARKEVLTITPLPPPLLTNAYADQVLRQLAKHFGLKTLRRQGLTIIVPYDPLAEEHAIRAVRYGVLEIEQRQYYRYPTHHTVEAGTALLAEWAQSRRDKPATPATDELIPALVESAYENGDLMVNDGRNQWLLKKPRWAWKSLADYEKEGMTEAALAALEERPRKWIPGDEIRLQGTADNGVRLSQDPSIESALYAIDLKRGTVLARVGGFDFKLGGFDRVRRAMRQPGSAFKPLLYTSAINAGSTPASIVMDTPMVFGNQQEDEFWRPENYKNKFAGPVTLRNALEHSRNLASIKILQNIGIKNFLRELENYPLQRKFPAQLALALGATEVTPEALIESYAVMASEGKKWKPVTIQQVQDRNGNTLHRSVSGNRCQICHVDPVMAVNEFMQPAEQVLDPINAFLITNMMKGVIEHGTGRRARALKRPAAGKTGTTNKQVDAWFIGYTPQILTGVWSGRDTPTSMGRRETGARAALPSWLKAMQAFHKGKKKKDFVPPDGIEWAVIDPKTGKLPGPDTENIFLEAFRAGTAPTEETPATKESPEEGKKRFFELGL